MLEVMHRLARAYAGRRILVTGGASFIGSHLSELLVQSGAEVSVADDLSSGKRGNLEAIASNITFLEGDLRCPDFAGAALGGQEVVFHLAASHGGRGYIDTHPIECTNNMLLDHIVLAAAADAGVRKVVLASSACTYPTSLQVDENSRLLLQEGRCQLRGAGQGLRRWRIRLGEANGRVAAARFLQAEGRLRRGLPHLHGLW